MKYKALICDIDGTLILNKRHAIPSKRVINATKKAKDIIHFGVATSRPIFALENILDHISLSGPSIINSGAQIVDFSTGKILIEHPINKNDVSYLLDFLLKLKCSFIVQDGKENIVPRKGGKYTNAIQFWVKAQPEKLAD